MFVVLACKVMVEVRVATTVPVRVRDQKPISRDCSLASDLVQAGKGESGNADICGQVRCQKMVQFCGSPLWMAPE